MSWMTLVYPCSNSTDVDVNAGATAGSTVSAQNADVVAHAGATAGSTVSAQKADVVAHAASAAPCAAGLWEHAIRMPVNDPSHKVDSHRSAPASAPPLKGPH
jgi:hypothetical protein